jgi:hypothetical protein
MFKVGRVYEPGVTAVAVKAGARPSVDPARSPASLISPRAVVVAVVMIFL